MRKGCAERECKGNKQVGWMEGRELHEEGTENTGKGRTVVICLMRTWIVKRAQGVSTETAKREITGNGGDEHKARKDEEMEKKGGREKQRK